MQSSFTIKVALKTTPIKTISEIIDANVKEVSRDMDGISGGLSIKICYGRTKDPTVQAPRSRFIQSYIDLLEFFYRTRREKEQRIGAIENLSEYIFAQASSGVLMTPRWDICKRYGEGEGDKFNF